MRIIAGIAKGRRLSSPGKATRPMTDRVKEAIFSSLGLAVVDARVLDLYAGSGSMGLEALSRGAASAVLVERDRSALNALRANVDTVGLGGTVVARDVGRYLDGAAAAGDEAAATFDLAFVDPPYALPLPSALEILERLEPRLTLGAMVVVHRPSGETSPRAIGSLALSDERRYGGATIWRYVKEER